MGRPKEHDDSTREALLLAAERLVELDGPDGVSVRAVADEIGSTTRAVYSVFGSKGGMLAALATRLFEILAEAIDACPTTDDPVADIVTMSLDGFRRTALEHRALYGLVFLRVVPNLAVGPDFADAATSAFGRLEAQLERVSELGRLGTTSPRDAARAVHAITEGLASMELRANLMVDAEAEAIWRSSVAALVNGFNAGKATAKPRGQSPPKQ